mmetsp:Transcript_1255/g.2009  ORF Transcript_1255/g.2009 Transcript_1255/m.2009 type:complete len:188 (-) Transcript_1255:228-791(-)
MAALPSAHPELVSWADDEDSEDEATGVPTPTSFSGTQERPCAALPGPPPRTPGPWACQLELPTHWGKEAEVAQLLSGLRIQSIVSDHSAGNTGNMTWWTVDLDTESDLSLVLTRPPLIGHRQVVVRAVHEQRMPPPGKGLLYVQFQSMHTASIDACSISLQFTVQRHAQFTTGSEHSSTHEPPSCDL